MRPTAALTLVRTLDGAALLLAPGALVRHAGVRADRPVRVVARVLGARHLLQAVLTGLRPDATVLWVGVAVDAIHALSAVGLATVDGHHRRAALANAASATAFAAAGAALAYRG